MVSTEPVVPNGIYPNVIMMMFMVFMLIMFMFLKLRRKGNGLGIGSAELAGGVPH
eukprot:CAMPEP_0201111554 /NCGR_PEP_ID=MMETSP0812-20130820/75408_1 /ASSEMBLY_ACC=CAM_ASM_000668 /TAXON_ID=98059 /ORGANISM="Dinobryon sp., Strain UTEXLB2267" /LENGTH=54 /DNA_ID=CAMNT_0047374605 /DNA_START=48 /DNA_END=209 /DNA_ORIENTATION=+